MIIIQHRINSSTELYNTPKKYGVEVDIRSDNNRLVIGHEAFKNRLKFNEWLMKYNHKFLIANIKEEGIENEVIQIIKKHKIKNYFLLDVTIPQIIKLEKKRKFKFAIRLSKFETYHGLKKFDFFHKWIWIDTFNAKIPFTNKVLENLELKKHKLCLVSPELGKPDIDLKKFIISNKLLISHFEAVCTKKTQIWSKYI